MHAVSGSSAGNNIAKNVQHIGMHKLAIGQQRQTIVMTWTFALYLFVIANRAPSCQGSNQADLHDRLSP